MESIRSVGKKFKKWRGRWDKPGEFVLDGCIWVYDHLTKKREELQPKTIVTETLLALFFNLVFYLILFTWIVVLYTLFH